MAHNAFAAPSFRTRRPRLDAGDFNLGGYVGPYVVGWIKDSSNSFEAGLYFLAACAIACAVITLFAARVSTPPEEAPAGAMRSAAE